MNQLCITKNILFIRNLYVLIMKFITEFLGQNYKFNNNANASQIYNLLIFTKILQF